jgi:hypothetical protein
MPAVDLNRCLHQAQNLGVPRSIAVRRLANAISCSSAHHSTHKLSDECISIDRLYPIKTKQLNLSVLFVSFFISPLSLRLRVLFSVFYLAFCMHLCMLTLHISLASVTTTTSTAEQAMIPSAQHVTYSIRLYHHRP